MQNKSKMRAKKYIGEKTGIIQRHIINNLKNYVLILIIFFIGIILGVLFINNTNETQQEEISGYINTLLDDTKKDISINSIDLFLSSIKKNLGLVCILWFAGLTVIGIFVVYAMIAFKGFSLGYSISAVIATIGIKKGALFIFSTMFCQNIILIPSIFAIAISRNKII